MSDETRARKLQNCKESAYFLNTKIKKAERWPCVIPWEKSAGAPAQGKTRCVALSTCIFFALTDIDF